MGLIFHFVQYYARYLKSRLDVNVHRLGILVIPQVTIDEMKRDDFCAIQ